LVVEVNDPLFAVEQIKAKNAFAELSFGAG
jgi:hypothetical protein